MTVKYVAEPGANFEKEFNDTEKQAYGITTNKVYTGNLSDAGDYDYYKFTLAQPGSVTVNLDKIVSNDGKYYFSLLVYDSPSDLGCLQHGYTETDINTNLNKQRLPAGDYYVKVGSDYDVGSEYYGYPFINADYQMTVKYVAEPGANFEKEFNDTVKQAYGISPNKIYTGNLSNEADWDIYKFTIAQPGSVTVNLNKIASNSGEYEISLLGYNSAGNRFLIVSGTTGSNINTNLNKQRLPAGDYFVWVKRDYYFTNADYRITVNYVAEPGDNFEKEFNDNSDQADVISLGKVYTGNLSDDGDWDIYKFTLAQPGSVNVNLNKIVSNGGGYYFFLSRGIEYNHFDVIEDRYTGTKINTNFFKQGLPAGDYYVVVNSYNSVFTNADYQLTVNLFTPPVVPLNLKAASPGYDSIKLSWAATAGITGYELYRSTSLNGTYTLVKTLPSSTLTFVDSGLTTNQTYYFKIRSYRVVGETSVFSSFSPTVSSKPVPAVPSSVKAISAGFNSVKVSWNAVPGASGYQVERRLWTTGTFAEVKTLAETSFLNSGLFMGKNYYFRVRAYRMVGTTKVFSPYSAIAGATPVLSAPTNLKAVAAGSQAAKLTWTAVPGASGYLVERRLLTTGTFAAVNTLTETSFLNSGLSTGKAYYYRIRAYRMVGTTKVFSPYSAIVEATPVPSVPTNLKAVAAGSKTAKLTWTAVSGASGYEVQRKLLTSGTYARVAAPTTNTWTNSGLTVGKTFYYRVRAYRMVGMSKVYGPYSSANWGSV